MKQITKRILCAILTIVMAMCTTTAYASTNWDSGDSGALKDALNGDNIWRIKDKNGKNIYEAEGLRVTVYNADDETKVFNTIDITGNPDIANVIGIGYFADSNGLIPKTTWLSSAYIGNTYTALDATSKTKYQNKVESKVKATGYESNYIPALSSLTIISENNTANLEAIRSLIGDEDFLLDLCTLISGLEYDDFVGGKYKIAFEPIAYMTIAGSAWVLTATECGILDKYMLNILNSATGALLSKMGPLTHSQLPLSAYLKERELDIQQFTASNADITYSAKGELRYRSNCIIRCMGIGVLSDLQTGDQNDGDFGGGNYGDGVTNTTAEYHTDVDVFTSFIFYNNSGEDMVSTTGAVFTIYNSDGETPALYNGPISERNENGIYASNEVDIIRMKDTASVTVYTKNTDHKDGYYGNPYKSIGTYKDGDKLRIDNTGGDEFSYVVKKSNGSTIATGELSFPCPNGDNGMAWFEWHTPKTAQDITISIVSHKKGVYIIDDGGNYCSSVTINASIDKVEEITPPDPKATDKKPSWFTPNSEQYVQNNATQYAQVDSEQELTWYVWECKYSWSYQDTNYRKNPSKFKYRNAYGKIEEEEYDKKDYGVYYEYYRSEYAAENGRPTKVKVSKAVYLGDCTFEKKEYSVSLTADITVKPSERCPTATYSNSTDTYTMKSGYGFEIEVDVHLRGNTTYCTGSQKANVLFPEFNYSTQNGYKYNRLLEKASGTFAFKKNEFSTYKGICYRTGRQYDTIFQIAETI